MDLTIYRGDTTRLNLLVVLAGAAYDLTGHNIWFTAKQSFLDADVSAVFQKSTTGGGIVITSALNGRAQITISPIDTEGLTNIKSLLVYDCQVESPGGDVYTVSYGNLIVLPDVTLTRV